MGFGSWISDTVSSATNVVSDAVSSATDAVSDAASNLGSTFGGGAFESVGDFFNNVKEAAGGDLDSVFDKVTDSIGGGAGGIWGQVSEAVGGGAGGIWGQVSEAVGGGAGGIWGQVSETVGEGAGGFFGAWTDRADDFGMTGGGWAGIGQGEDIGGMFGGFGKLLDGDDDGVSLSDLLPSGVGDAISDGFDLPFVGDALDGISLQDLAGSLPGLDGPLSSLGMAADGLTDHIEGVVTAVVDPGAAWSMGTGIADAGTGFLGQIADIKGPGDIYGCVVTCGNDAGIDLPSWATNLATDPVTTLGSWGAAAGGGFVPPVPTFAPPYDPGGYVFGVPTDGPQAWGEAFTDYPGQEASAEPGDPIADAGASDVLGHGLDDELGESDAGLNAGLDEGLDTALDEGLGDTVPDDDTGLDDFAAPAAPDPGLDAAPEVEPTLEHEPPPPAPEPEPVFEAEPEPAPPPEPASAQIESDFDAIGDDAFGAQ